MFAVSSSRPGRTIRTILKVLAGLVIIGGIDGLRATGAVEQAHECYKCVSTAARAAECAHEMGRFLEGERFRVTGTPTVVINGFSCGDLVPGSGEPDRRIRAILDGRHPFPDAEATGHQPGLSEARVGVMPSVDDDPTCPECVIEFELVMTLGSLDAPDWFSGEPRSIARDSRGRIYAAFPDLGQVLRFDSAGRAVQTIGRTGDGPGEYRRPYLVRADQFDSIFVVDGTYRLTVLAPSSRFVRRTPPLVQAGDLRFTGEGSVVFGGLRLWSSDGGSNDVSFHVLDADGAAIDRSFHTMDSDQPPRFYLASAPEPDRFWAIYRSVDQYEVIQYATDGTLTRRFTRNPLWIRSLPPEDNFPAPRPSVRGLYEAAEGQLWILGRHPVEDWPRYWNLQLALESETAGRNLREETKLFRSVVEVLDIESGRLLTSDSVPGLVLDFLPDRHVATYREDDAGIAVIDVLRMSVSVPPRRGESHGR